MSKTYYSVADLGTGDVLPETWVDQVRINLDGLIAPPAVHVYNSADILIGNASFTALTFNSERFDTDAMHSTGSNTGRITFATAGLYHVGGNITWDINGANSRAVAVRLNGSTVLARTQVPAVAEAGNGTGVAVSVLYDFAASDYVELTAYQNSGGNLNVLNAANFSPEFWAVWVGRSSAP